MKRHSKSSRKSRNTVGPPPEIARAIEAAVADDRRWFEENPSEETRTRPAAPNEFWPVFDSNSVVKVIVTQVRPGVRFRCPLVRMNLPIGASVQ